MMKSEFEKIVGYEVSDEDYVEIIEPMYMATTLDKYEFAKCINRERFEKKEIESKMISRIKELSKRIYDKCGSSDCMDERIEICELLEELEKKYGFNYELIKDTSYGFVYPKTLNVFTPLGTKVKSINLVGEE